MNNPQSHLSSIQVKCELTSLYRHPNVLKSSRLTGALSIGVWLRAITPMARASAGAVVPVAQSGDRVGNILSLAGQPSLIVCIASSTLNLPQQLVSSIVLL